MGEQGVVRDEGRRIWPSSAGRCRSADSVAQTRSLEITAVLSAARLFLLMHRRGGVGSRNSGTGQVSAGEKKQEEAGCHAGPLRCMARCPMQTAAGAAEWVSPTPFNFSAPRLWFSPSARIEFLKQRLITRACCLVEIGSQPWDIVNTPTGEDSEFDRRPAKPSHQDSQAVLVHGPHVPGSKLRAAQHV